MGGGEPLQDVRSCLLLPYFEPLQSCWQQSRSSIAFKMYSGDFLVAQWLRFSSPTAGGTGLILGQGTKTCILFGTAKNKKLKYKTQR